MLDSRRAFVRGSYDWRLSRGSGLEGARISADLEVRKSTWVRRRTPCATPTWRSGVGL